jgi:hypothetical protein
MLSVTKCGVKRRESRELNRREGGIMYGLACKQRTAGLGIEIRKLARLV